MEETATKEQIAPGKEETPPVVAPSIADNKSDNKEDKVASLAKQIYGPIKEQFAKQGLVISRATIVAATIKIMLVVEKSRSLKSDEKKAAAIAVLKLAIADAGLDKDELMLVDAAMDAIIPAVIDSIILAASGSLAFNTLGGRLKKLCGCCCK